MLRSGDEQVQIAADSRKDRNVHRAERALDTSEREEPNLLRHRVRGAPESGSQVRVHGHVMRKTSVDGRERHTKKQAGDYRVSSMRDDDNGPAPALFAATLRVQVDQDDIAGAKRRSQRPMPLYSGYSSVAEVTNSSNPAAAQVSTSVR